jgi:hypothetical protein
MVVLSASLVSSSLTPALARGGRGGGGAARGGGAQVQRGGGGLHGGGAAATPQARPAPAATTHAPQRSAAPATRSGRTGGEVVEVK